MTFDSFLSRFEGVQRRGSRYLMTCLAHDDRTPSLQVTQGERAVLLKCWAGCSLGGICASLGIRPADLFYDVHDQDPAQRRVSALARNQQRQQQAADTQRHGRRIDALKAADYHVRSRRGVDISGWSDQKLNDELNVLVDAYALLESEESYG